MIKRIYTRICEIIHKVFFFLEVVFTLRIGKKASDNDDESVHEDTEERND